VVGKKRAAWYVWKRGNSKTPSSPEHVSSLSLNNKDKHCEGKDEGSIAKLKAVIKGRLKEDLRACRKGESE